MFVRFLESCSVCDEPQTTDYPAGVSAWTELDLDLKSPADTGWLWPHPSARCISCGACGTTIWNYPPAAAAFVKSPEYRGAADAPLPAGYRDEVAASLLAEHVGWLGNAFEHSLVASWIAEESQRWGLADEVDWTGLADAARRRAVELWIQAAEGDPTAGPLARCTEQAAATIVGDVLLDNQLLVELLRRLGEWERAGAAAANARRAINETLEAWGGPDELHPETREIVRVCQAALDLEDVLIEHRDSTRAHARLDVPVWFAE